SLCVDHHLADAPEVAEIALLNLALARLHPGAARRGALLADAVIEDAAVADTVGPRRPTLLAPPLLQPQVVVLKLVVRRDGAVDFARDPNGGSAVDLDDRVHMLRVAIEAHVLEVLPFRVTLELQF